MAERPHRILNIPYFPLSHCAFLSLIRLIKILVIFFMLPLQNSLFVIKYTFVYRSRACFPDFICVIICFLKRIGVVKEPRVVSLHDNTRTTEQGEGSSRKGTRPREYTPSYERPMPSQKLTPIKRLNMK